MDKNKNDYIIINKLSSCAGSVDIDYIKHILGGKIIYFNGNKNLLPKNAKSIAMCGGDGTLNHLINDYANAQKYYIPCGTFNESAKCAINKNNSMIDNVGKVNDKYFAYVLAAGAFTPLGYSTSDKIKHKFKIFAYLLNILKEYKIYRIPCEITAENKKYNDNFSLIMVSNACRCFGFRFNRLYSPKDKTLQLLLIKSPKHNGLLGKAEMFIPFFRCFFIGFNKEKVSKKIIFINADNVSIKTPPNTPYCVDGDKWIFSGEILVESTALEKPVKILSAKKQRKIQKKL